MKVLLCWKVLIGAISHLFDFQTITAVLEVVSEPSKWQELCKSPILSGFLSAYFPTAARKNEQGSLYTLEQRGCAWMLRSWLGVLHKSCHMACEPWPMAGDGQEMLNGVGMFLGSLEAEQPLYLGDVFLCVVSCFRGTCLILFRAESSCRANTQLPNRTSYLQSRISTPREER